MKLNLLLWGVAITALTGTLIVGRLHQEIIPEVKESSTYSNIEELRDSVRFSFNIPEALLEEKDLVYKNRYNQSIEISNNEVDFKAAIFVADKASIDGDYSSSKIDKEYKVDGDTKIKYLRIQTDSDSVDSMKDAKVSYNTGDTAYTLKVNKSTSYNEIINELGLSEEQVKGIDNEKKSETASVVEGDKYDVYSLNSLGYTIELPKLLTAINTVSGEANFKYETFILSDKAVMSVEEAKSPDKSSEQVEVVELGNGYRLKYYKDNPFDKDTVEYKSYSNILNSIKYIVNSFKIIKK